MATRLFLLRHGQTDWSRDDRFTGASDVPLNEVGRSQARALAERLARAQWSLRDDTLADAAVLADGAQQQIAAVYCSPLARSMETARIVAAPFQLPVQVVPDLRELDYGAWEGLRREEILQRFPHEFELWSKDPALYPPPSGESGLTLVARVRPAMDRLIAEHPHQTILVAAHKTVNRLLICSLFNIPLEHYRWIIWQNVACLNILNFVSHDAVSLIRLNDTAHYESIVGDER